MLNYYHLVIGSSESDERNFGFKNVVEFNCGDKRNKFI